MNLISLIEREDIPDDAKAIISKHISKSTADYFQVSESEKILRQITNHITEVFWMTNKELTEIIYVSNGYEKIWGRPLSELYENPFDWVDSIVSENQETFLKEMQAASLEEKEVSVEYQIKRPDGELRWINDRAFPVYDENGEFIRMAGIAKDITEKKLQEDKIRFLSMAVEQSPAYVFITDAEGNINYVNRSFSQGTGYSFEEIRGKKPNIFKTGKHGEGFYKHLWDTVKSGKQWSGEFLNKYKDGSLHWDKSAIAPIMNDKNEITNFVAVVDDWTKFKKLKSEAEKAAKVKSQFLANMSHEIRTPMNGILGGAQLMLENDLSAEQRSMAEIIYHSADSLLKIINDILDFSKLEAGKVTLEKISVDIKRVIGDVCTLLKPQAEKKKIPIYVNFSKDDFPYFICDPTRLRQIILNLVNNAIKFTDEGSVELNINLTKIDRKRFKIDFQVKDTGIGISKQNIEKIFQSFTQAEFDITRKYGGTGLGMAISRQLAQLMEGDISVTSKLGKGSAFTFSVPMEATNQKYLSGETTKEALVRDYKRKILLAEDNQINSVLAKKMMTGLGIELDVVENGKLALENSNGDYDLIILDIHMPVMDGITAAKKIIESGCSLPILAFTASAFEEDKKVCLEAGMKGVITKPLIKKSLIQELDRYL